MKMNLFIILITLTLILGPSFALISSSQTNDTSDDVSSQDNTSLNQSAFSSMSRELAKNQSGLDDDSNEDND
jgi:hypothetical protein